MRGSRENSEGAYTVEQGAAESVAGSHRVNYADMPYRNYRVLSLVAGGRVDRGSPRCQRLSTREDPHSTTSA